jgi:hypothetical protein
VAQLTGVGVTAKAERAGSLFTTLAQDRMLDPGALSGEIDAMLDLLERADREGRSTQPRPMYQSPNTRPKRPKAGISTVR